METGDETNIFLPSINLTKILSGVSSSIQEKKKANANRYQCPLCHYCSAELGKLQRHIRCVHTGEKPFHCTYCPYRTGDKSCLRKHHATHKGKAFQCPVCPYSAAHQHKLDEHMKTHVDSNNQ